MIIYFSDKQNLIIRHAEFQAWRQQNPRAYFLNLKSKYEAMMHTVDCRHLGNTEWMCGEDGSHSLTRKTKVCSSSIAVLNNWAITNDISQKKCQDCNPFEQALSSN